MQSYFKKTLVSHKRGGDALLRCAGFSVPLLIFLSVIFASACGAQSQSINNHPSSLLYQPVTITSSGALVAATINLPYKDIVAVENGLSPFSFSLASGALPVGLTLDSESGMISGTVASSEEGNRRVFEVAVTDANSSTDNKSLSIQVNSYTFSLSPTALPTFIPFQPYSQTISSVGATLPVSYAVIGTLPTGLSFNNATATLSVAAATQLASGTTPTTVIIQATDANGVVVIENYSLKSTDSSYQPVALEAATLSAIPVDSFYAATLTTSGGMPPFSFAITSGGLPSGLSLATATGVISGTVSAASVTNLNGLFTVTVTDGYGQTSQQSYNYSLSPYKISVIPTLLPHIVPSINFSMQLAAIGASGSTTFSLYGSLPPNLSLSSSGVLSTSSGGIPLASASSSWPVTIYATDANGIVGSLSTTIHVDAAPSTSSSLAIQTFSLNQMIAGSPYFSGIATTGGIPPLSYSVLSGALPAGLTMSPTTGIISGNISALYYGEVYSVQIEVTDGNGATSAHSFVGTIGGLATASALRITATSLPSFSAGSPFAGIVTSTGGITPYTFSVSSGSLPAGIILESSSGALRGTPSYASAGTSYSFTITVTDSSLQSVSESYSGSIGAITPALAVNSSQLVAPVAGLSYSAAIPTSNGVAPLAFSLSSGTLPYGLELSSATGFISGSLPYSSAGNAYSFTVAVSDAAGQSTAMSYGGSIISSVAALSILSTSLPALNAGSSYASAIAVSGGVTPYSFTLASGSLPSGLTLTSSGQLTGTPSYASAGTSYSFSVTVSDSGGNTTSQQYSGGVGAVTPALSIETGTIATPLAGAPYSSAIAQSYGVSPLSYQISSGSLPAGLSLNSSTGVISGSIPYAAAGASYSFTIKLTDSAGQQSTNAYLGSVGSEVPTLSLTSSSLASPAAGQLYAAALGVTGGVTPYSFALSSGSLPSGLSLYTSTGIISGTASYSTSGTSFAFGVTVSDSSGQTSSQSYSVIVSSTASVIISTGSLAAPTAGAGYQATVAASGGLPPYSFSLSSGSLPSGLSLSSSGIISGTASFSSHNSSFAFVVGVSDDDQHTASQAYSFEVADYSLSLFPAALTAAEPGAYYEAALGVAGGQSPYAFSLSSGILPTGLSMSSSGVISGLVASSEAGQTHAITVTASDANGASVSRSYSLSTSSFSVVVTTSALSTAYESLSYSNQGVSLAASGGSAPYTYQYSGSLPSGVGLSSTGTFFGTPASGQGSLAGVSYPISVRATDASGVISAASTLTLEVAVSSPVMSAGTFSTGILGMPYIHKVSASGGRSPYSYSLSGSLPSGLSLSSVGYISGTPSTQVSCPAASFSIIATDALSQQSSSSVSQCIPTALGIVLANSSLSTAVEGQAYSNSGTALAASSGVAPYTYSYTGTLPRGVGLSSGGVFFGTPAVGTGSLSGVSYSVKILVTDSAGSLSLPVTLTLTVTTSTPSVSTSSLPEAVLGAPYSTTLSASGGRSSYSFSLASGSLPTGLAMSSAGVISGTPSVATSCPSAAFSVQATDSLGQQSAASSLCITTSNGLNIEASSSVTGYVGVSFASSVAVSGGSAPFTYAASGLPSGISINSQSGIVSGITQASTGDYSTFYTVSDSSTTAESATFAQIFHLRSPLTLSSLTLPIAAVASGTSFAYSTSITGSGGLSPLSYSITSGSLPSGLSMSSAGLISGTPGNKTPYGSPYSFTVTAKDSAGQSVSQSYSLVVAVAPVITNTFLPPAAVSVPYAVDLQRLGGANPFISSSNTASQLTWSATGLPSGLSLANGRISGTTSVSSGTYSVAISLTDANSLTTTKTLPLKVVSAGKTLDLKSARFSEPCLGNNTNCSPQAYAIAKLNGGSNSQQFVVYNRNDTKTIQIAKIDPTGRIPLAGATMSINIALPSNTGTISSLQIADLDQDGILDIVFVDNTNKQVCSLWGNGAVDANGMPSGFSSSNINCWVIPVGGDAGNSPYSLGVYNYLRPDNTNYGKEDLVVSSSQAGGAGNSTVVLLNKCAAGGSCTSSRPTLFNGYNSISAGVTSGSTTVSVTSTSGVAVGIPVAGVGIPANTTVSSFVTNSSITLSQAATSSVASSLLSLPLAVATTGTTGSGSATISSVASTSGISVGQSIIGTGIPPGTSVTAFTGSTITMSQNATATNAGENLVIFGPTLVTPYIIAASAKMTFSYDFGVGFFNAANPLLSSGRATSAATCPSIVVGGEQQTSNNYGAYLYIVRQNFSSGQCQGDFQLHSSTDEQQVIYGASNPDIDTLLVTDFNNDGISDIAVGMGASNLASSASLRVYMMPGGATFSGDTVLTPELQTVNNVYVGASKITSICLNGSLTCNFPSLFVTLDRASYFGRNTTYAGISVFPNLCSSTPCTAAFETGTPTERFDYPGPWGQNREPVVASLVASGSFTLSGNVTSGTNLITSASSISGVSIGQPIYGPGIPSNAYVTAAAGSTITMSVNATTSQSSASLSTPTPSTLGDVALMGTDSTNTTPFFLVLPRNGTSTSDPFKADLALNAFPASYLGAAEIGTMKLVDINNDGTLDLLAYLVNQGGVASYVSNMTASPTISLGNALTPNYLDNIINYPTCPEYSSVCLPDPLFNATGVTQGYPGTPSVWHMQNTMDVMDVNNDGVPDAVVIGYGSNDVAVLLGSVSGEFSAPALYPIGSVSDYHPQAVAFADLDQDGIPDIVVAGIDSSGSQSGYFSWLKGNGDGSFQTAVQITGFPASCTDPRSITAVDLDGDGRPELAVLCYTSQALWVARRNSSGVWVGQTSATINPSGGSSGTVMKWGRLTSTSGMDVAVAGIDGTNSLRIITGVSATVTNAVSGSFTLSSTPGSYQSLQGVASDIDIADLNADGYSDLVVGMQSQNGATATTNGEIFYSCQSTTAGSCTLKGWGMAGYQTTSVVAGDLNGDGLPDLMVGYRAGAAAYERMIYRTLTRNLNTSY